MLSTYRRHYSHIIQITALLLERGATLALAVLLLRIHLKMAQTQSLAFMHSWVKSDKYYTMVTLAALVLAFVLSLTDELILWVVDSQRSDAGNYDY
jgi:hypothetical protein